MSFASAHTIRAPASNEEEDEIILIPAFNLTLVGRMFNRESRSTEALLAFMPKAMIWDIEGRVKGIDLGQGKFQFDFEQEEDLEKVLSKRPCHFNKWSFSLERWVPNIWDDFPCTMLFWIRVTGVPTHYWSEIVFRHIGNALGEVVSIDERGGRIQVSVRVDGPLKFEKKTKFANGDIISISLEYEKLYRYCFYCKRISHEERTCPELNNHDRRDRKLIREAKRASKEAENSKTRESRTHLQDKMKPQTQERNVEKDRDLALRRNEHHHPNDRSLGKEHQSLHGRYNAWQSSEFPSQEYPRPRKDSYAREGGPE